MRGGEGYDQSVRGLVMRGGEGYDQSVRGLVMSEGERGMISQ